MQRKLKTRLAVGAVVLAAAVGGGAALAATQGSSPSQESQAVVNDAADELGITPSKLTTALKNALAKRVDAAVADGRLTKAQGDELKARLQAGAVPFLFPRPEGAMGHAGRFPGAKAAASYLGLSPAKLGAQLKAGKTLAQIAKERGKSVDGLIDALVADAKKHLDAAVSAGRLTDAQRDAILSGLRDRITDLVNGKAPPPPEGLRGPGGHGPSGPPPPFPGPTP